MKKHLLVIVVALALIAASCSDDSDPGTEGADTGGSDAATENDDTPAADEPGDRSDETATEDSASRFEATVRYTAHGVPHILAEDWGGLGFGQGYTATADRGCIVADQVLKVRGERSLFFGPGEENELLNVDFGYKSFGLVEQAEAEFASLPESIRELLLGYTAGFNLFLEEHGPEGFPGWCAGEEWVRPITHLDYLAYIYDGSLLVSGNSLVQYVGGAQPPESAEVQISTTPLTIPAHFASSGWAFGSDRTESGGGMVLVNPQFGWHGGNQFRENHLTIPGVVDVYGASFGGFPGIQVGFNDGVAWTHTAAAGNRFTAYTLDLVPGQPTQYRYDDEVRNMTSSEATVSVLQDDGSVVEQSRTMYSTHYGPVIVVPGLGEWTDTAALTYRDANQGNEESLAQWLGMNLATTMDDFQSVYEEVSGIPWVNTMAASADGRAWFIDGSATPNLSDEAIDLWLGLVESDAVTDLAYDNGVVLLDGSDSRFEWVDDPNARDPGVIPFADQPSLERRDEVSNGNQSHWIANSDAPLEGYSPLIGEEREQFSLRPRMVALLAEDESAEGLSGEDGLFSLEELEQLIFVNRSLTGVLLRDQVVERCTGAGPVDTESGTVDIAEACDVLDSWDLNFDVDSVGAILWRQVWSPMTGSGYKWKVPFDPEDPLLTRRDLADPDEGEMDFVLTNIAAAVAMLTQAGFDVDVPLGDAQFVLKGDEQIPIHGGIERDGVASTATTDFNLANSLEPNEHAPYIDGSTGLTEAGYYADRGPAMIMAIEMTEDGPIARSIAGYSQSKDPDSPYFADQTHLYSMEQFKPVLFTEDEIMADSDLRVEELSVERAAP